MSVQGVIFDLDGTLTRPHLDFARIRLEIGLPSASAAPILEALAEMDAESRTRATAILERHEHEAAQASELNPGAIVVIEALRSRNVPVGILTRNSRTCTQIVIDLHGLEIDCVHTREDGPVKPAPDAILAMCLRWQAEPARVWMVGDYLFDVQAGRSAGTRTVLMVADQPLPPFASQADHVIRRLDELPVLMGLD
jgi:HAD superfamily hydrolase (TIGR01509 family)